LKMLKRLLMKRVPRTKLATSEIEITPTSKPLYKKRRSAAKSKAARQILNKSSSESNGNASDELASDNDESFNCPVSNFFSANPGD